MHQTKDQGPDPIQFPSNEQIDFLKNAADQRPIQLFCDEQINIFPNTADQRPRTRSHLVSLQWAN
jgi:hypothetical protein